MNEQEIKELNKAISKLSEEDQAQISGGNKITDKQCAQLQGFIDNPMLVKYGGPMPKKPIIDLPNLEPPEVNPVAAEYGGPVPKIGLSKLKKPSEESSDGPAT